MRDIGSGGNGGRDIGSDGKGKRDIDLSGNGDVILAVYIFS